jgi:hypothetical protein
MVKHSGQLVARIARHRKFEESSAWVIFIVGEGKEILVGK